MTVNTLSRTTINLSKVQLDWLADRAQSLGIGWGELLRRIIDEKREHVEAVKSAQRIQRARREAK